jgi:hypothetical protein
MMQARNYPWDKRYHNVTVYEQSATLVNPDIECVVRTYQWRNKREGRTALKVCLTSSIVRVDADLIMGQRWIVDADYMNQARCLSPLVLLGCFADQF